MKHLNEYNKIFYKKLKSYKKKCSQKFNMKGY